MCVCECGVIEEWKGGENEGRVKRVYIGKEVSGFGKKKGGRGAISTG